MRELTARYSIAGRDISADHAPYMIAEISGNHNGNIENALRLIREAAHAGADAVKFQTYTPDTITIDHDGPGFVINGGLWDGRSLHELYEEAHTPWEWHEQMFRCASEAGITAFSSPFDFTAVDFLERFDVPAYKIASFEIVDTPLIEYAAKTGKPMIVSTGMASHDEIDRAIGAVKAGGGQAPVLLHCISGYPTPASEGNLPRMNRLRERHDCLAGLSDHTLGNATAVAATALGAVVIEKHFTLDRADGGPDAAFSLMPDELKTLVGDLKDAHAATRSREHRYEGEVTNSVLRRSLYVVSDISEGEFFTAENIKSIRPGHGLEPRYLPSVIGCRATGALGRGTPLLAEHVCGFVESH